MWPWRKDRIKELEVYVDDSPKRKAGRPPSKLLLRQWNLAVEQLADNRKALEHLYGQVKEMMDKTTDTFDTIDDRLTIVEEQRESIIGLIEQLRTLLGHVTQLAVYAPLIPDSDKSGLRDRIGPNTAAH